MKIKKHEDERGWLIEAFKAELKDGQVYAFTINPGKTRGRHYHKIKEEWFCVLKGEGTIKVGDKEHRVGAQSKLHVPPGAYHEITNTGKETMIVIAFINRKYDPENPDTYMPEG